MNILASNPVYSNQKLLANGTYSEPFPTQEFAKNWASAPNTWPVGPIDLDGMLLLKYGRLV